jgi:hypothetical protein
LLADAGRRKPTTFMLGSDQDGRAGHLRQVSDSIVPLNP